jgi:hypothetical protein
MKKRNNEQWRELFARHDTIGVSTTEFCKQHDLCPKHFSLRRKQLAKVVGETEPGFVRVNIKPEAYSSKTHGLVINLGRLNFGVVPPVPWLTCSQKIPEQPVLHADETRVQVPNGVDKAP